MASTRVLYHHHRFHLHNARQFRDRIIEEKSSKLSRQDLQVDQKTFAKFLPAWTSFRHLTFYLGYCWTARNPSEDLSVVTSVFPNVQSLRLAAYAICSESFSRYIVFSAAMKIFEGFSSWAATYRCRDVGELGNNSEFKEFSMTLFNTEKSQNAEDPVGLKFSKSIFRTTIS